MSSHSPTPSPREHVLVCDSDALVRAGLTQWLTAAGMQAESCEHLSQAIEKLDARDSTIDVLIIDAALSGTESVDAFFERLDLRARPVAVIVMAGYATVETAVACLRKGAADYLVKPIVDAELRSSLDRALAHSRLLGENSKLRRFLAKRDTTDAIVGSDSRMHRVYELVDAVAASKTTVLMTGESGTGKSLIAHAIHRQSARRDKPFVEISCGSIPETLLESELFGHVKGAFTGAHADKVGRFLAASGGTLFLDEINSASAAMQLKLLRALQERRFEPVGSTTTVEVDVRVILASNQPLEQLVASGHFRQDLYYRINVVTIELPPLRERLADVPLLAARFLDRHARELGKQLIGFAPEAMKALITYQYPGNVRELSNIVERAAVLTRSPTIGLESLPSDLTINAEKDRHALVPVTIDQASTPWVPMSLQQALLAPEREILLRALNANGWSRQETARQLEINRATLYKKMKAHGLLECREANMPRLAS